ncbi:MltF family protein [Anditalea andensis]|uniref:ABC transporter substrate-binding protein n=1 Tax=Anditalea andensis TaxID=1048983 RepID=A0A074KYE3_9BACT|nr:transporter substrate-binding domain-containing protein [Anditalea andensis]KEO73230.1 ABC transporter substrate-binding protein [Anditalea andensis]
MRKVFWVKYLFLFIFLALAGCKEQPERERQEFFWENPVHFDLEDIKRRGYLRVAVDNSSTSYYIYRGRRMGYEFELLRLFSRELGVQLRVTVASDLDEVFRMLNEGAVDIIAINLEKTTERVRYAAFTQSTHTLKTVLVQRNDNGSTLKSIADLAGKTVHVREGAVYKQQLMQWNDNLELGMEIIEELADSEALVNAVVQREIDYTVVDDDVALVNATYYDNIDVSLEISEASKVGWAVRNNAPDLLNEINTWLSNHKKTELAAVLYEKYFLNKKNSYFRSNSPFSSISGNRISIFDEIIMKGAEQLGWDWRLLAALVFKESRFDTAATSYAGATGLLQLMPVTLERFGVEDPSDPHQSLMGGVNYLKYLDQYWIKRVPEVNERIRFILASYNVGHGHVEDSWRLALKAGNDTTLWENVAAYLEQKSDPDIYRDPLVKSGYAKGHVAVRYVDEVISLYESYKVLVSP